MIFTTATGSSWWSGRGTGGAAALAGTAAAWPRDIGALTDGDRATAVVALELAEGERGSALFSVETIDGEPLYLTQR
ncbi:hypothetical protein JSY14_12000 [Brachybacterium sp. EF45031]|uniref:hypothetical protein n=1 Tax=Brachybacterium sillae TaxID=2810536 RepID=UPI00217D78B7|nr:hypothetical protein [Brachybacterium sillae]MCS6712701.1 hypothetical protein [Brachybacterium sillae]